MKKHWTQTYEGRKRLAYSMKKAWARRKKDVQEIDSALRTNQPNGFSIREKLAHATTIEELNEVKSFLDLKDELLGRLP